MLHVKSDSDVTSSAPSSPSSSSPKRPVYYVESPSSRDSHDGDKSSSIQATPVYNSPMESPSHESHPSSGRHSRASSSSRFSGHFRSSSGRKGRAKRNYKGLHECNAIQEEGSYDDFDEKGLSRPSQALVALLAFGMLFTVFSLIIWGASRPFRAEIVVKSLSVNNFHFGEGADYTGVPTKMLTMNCSMKMSIYNPATFFGIHVSSTPISLKYSELPIATGQMRNYYQPRKSYRIVTITLEGNMVPLYGAGASFAVSDNNGEIPLRLEFEISTRGYVVGKLVKTKHRKFITCTFIIDSGSNKLIKFKEGSCKYD